MAARITVAIAPTTEATLLLATDGGLNEILRAKLAPPWRVHRWAAPTFLEGLSLWFQEPLSVVLSVDAEETSSGLQLSDGLGFGHKNLYYDVEVIERWRRGARLSGIADFQKLRRICRRGAQ
ncbi:MAG: hypothetical protein ACREN5_16625 [Gemmatimonadales bacterium]